MTPSLAYGLSGWMYHVYLKRQDGETVGQSVWNHKLGKCVDSVFSSKGDIIANFLSTWSVSYWETNI